MKVGARILDQCIRNPKSRSVWQSIGDVTQTKGGESKHQELESLCISNLSRPVLRNIKDP